MRAFAAILFLVAAVITLFGWVKNLYGVVSMALAGSALTTLFLLKAVGIFLYPLGAVLGFVS